MSECVRPKQSPQKEQSYHTSFSFICIHAVSMPFLVVTTFLLVLSVFPLVAVGEESLTRVVSFGQETLPDLAAWSNDGTRLATASRSGGNQEDVGRIRIWSATDWQKILVTQEGDEVSKPQIGSLAWSPDDSMLAAGDRHGTVKIWSTTSGELLQSLRIDRGVKYGWWGIAVAWSPDGSRLATGRSDDFGGGGNILIWDAATWTFSPTVAISKELYGSPVDAFFWHPDGSKLAVVKSDGLLAYGRLTLSKSSPVTLSGAH